MSEENRDEVSLSGSKDDSVLIVDDGDSNRTPKKHFVDLTKGYGPLIVDLTKDDTPEVVVSSGSRRNQKHIPRLDKEEITGLDDCSDEDVPGSSLSSPSKSPAKKIVCPVCMEDSKQIFRQGNKLVSTMCGHVFCENCLKEALNMQKKCPTCRRKLTSKQFHPLYI